MGVAHLRHSYRRILSVFLLLAICVSVLPFRVVAANEDIQVTVSAGGKEYAVTATAITGYKLADGTLINLKIHKVSVPQDAGDVIFSTSSTATNIVDLNYVTATALSNGQATIATNKLTQKPYMQDVRTDGNASLGMVFQVDNGKKIEEILDLKKTIAYIEFTADTANYVGLFGLVIEFTQSVNKSELETVLETARTIKNGDSHYKQDDRYNGNIYSKMCIRDSVKSVSEMLGHADIKTTLKLYVHPSLESKRRCIQQINFLKLGA